LFLLYLRLKVIYYYYYAVIIVTARVCRIIRHTHRSCRLWPGSPILSGWRWIRPRFLVNAFCTLHDV